MGFEDVNQNKPEEGEFDEICQFCKQPTGVKVTVENSHGTCEKCLPIYQQELEDNKAYFAELKRAREERGQEKRGRGKERA